MEALNIEDVEPEEEEEEEEEPTPRKKKRKPESETRIIKRIREADDLQVLDYLQQLGGETSMMLKLIRLHPESWGGRNVGGTLDTYYQPITEEEIKSEHGGGKLQLKIFTKNSKGSWQFRTSKTFKIAGDPRLDNLIATGPSVQNRRDESASAVERAMDLSEQLVERAYSERDHRRGGDGMDVATVLDTLMRPIQELTKMSQQQANEFRQTLLDVTRKPEGESFQDKLLGKMIDQESSKLEAIRMQHESELRVMRENHHAELKDLRRQHAADLDRLEKRHDREIETLKQSYETSGKAVGTAQEIRSDAQNREIDRLNRELTEARAKIATLEAKKDKPIVEQLTDIATIKEALGEFGGGDDEPKHWIERLAGVVLNSPVGNKLGGMIEGATEEENSAPNEMMPPVGVPFQAPDGNIYVRQPDDSIVQVDPKSLRRQRAAAARSGEGGGEAAGAAEPEMRAPDEAEIAAAIAFMESAFESGTPPDDFARSAKSMVPQPILAYIEQVGVDDFLNKVARLDQKSPFRQQTGRNWARAVAKVLLEGATK